jgi:mevalonate kinase
MTVTATPRTDGNVVIESQLGSAREPIANVQPTGPFCFANAVLGPLASALPGGVTLAIESSFSDQVGLGSSAAVTVAVTAAAQTLAGMETKPEDLHCDCLKAVHVVQGLGSGADLAASIFGGLVMYRVEPRTFVPLHNFPEIVLVYSGSKMPTPEVVRIVDQHRAKEPIRFEQIFDAMDQDIDSARTAIETEDWDLLGTILSSNQRYMEQIGLSNQAIDEIIGLLSNEPGITGAKISGSGLGDCVLGIGHAELRDGPYEVIPVQISPEGVRVD